MDVLYKDKKIRSTSKGYFYISLPKQLVAAMPSKFVSIEKVTEGILLRGITIEGEYNGEQ